MVVEDGELVGIFTPKDLMSRAVAKECVLELTAVSSVMTPNPESVLPDVTVLEALQTMHEYKFLSLPVCESDGTVVGLVDVMDLILGVGGAAGWRSIFSSIDDNCNNDNDSFTDAGSVVSFSHSVQSSRLAPPSTIRLNVGQGRNGSQLSSMQASKYDALPSSPGHSMIQSDFTKATGAGGGAEFVFKVVDSAKNTHRIKTDSDNINKLKKLVGEKLGKCGDDVDKLVLKFKDEDGDDVVISCDDSLKDAVENAKGAGEKNLKLRVTVENGNGGGVDTFNGGNEVNSSFLDGDHQKYAIVGGGVLVGLAVLAGVLMRGSKR